VMDEVMAQAKGTVQENDMKKELVRVMELLKELM